jgi:hypothetical protein
MPEMGSQVDVLAGEIGGAEGDRTLDLRIANATLSQLSYRPTRDGAGWWEPGRPEKARDSSIAFGRVQWIRMHSR